MLFYRLNDDEETEVGVTDLGFPKETEQQVAHLQNIVGVLDLPISHVTLDAPDLVAVDSLPQHLAHQLRLDGELDNVVAEIDVGSWGSDVVFYSQTDGSELCRLNGNVPNQKPEYGFELNEGAGGVHAVKNVFPDISDEFLLGSQSLMACVKVPDSGQLSIGLNNIRHTLQDTEPYELSERSQVNMVFELCDGGVDISITAQDSEPFTFEIGTVFDTNQT